MSRSENRRAARGGDFVMFAEDIDDELAQIGLILCDEHSRSAPTLEHHLLRDDVQILGVFGRLLRDIRVLRPAPRVRNHLRATPLDDLGLDMLAAGRKRHPEQGPP